MVLITSASLLRGLVVLPFSWSDPLLAASFADVHLDVLPLRLLRMTFVNWYFPISVLWFFLIAISCRRWPRLWHCKSLLDPGRRVLHRLTLGSLSLRLPAQSQFLRLDALGMQRVGIQCIHDMLPALLVVGL